MGTSTPEHVGDPTMAQNEKAAWVQCPCCDNFVCSIHGVHVHECVCPPLEVWDSGLGMNPYEGGGNMTPESLEKRLQEIGYVEG